MSKLIFEIKLLILALLYSLCIPTLAQTYYFDKYGVHDGLAQSKVYCTVQDKSGFLWIGTSNGLSTFDGIAFHNYSTESGLADNGVKCIFIDAEGVIWLGHIGGGITRCHGLTFEIINVNEIKNDITSIVEDSEGKIWLSTVGDGAVRIENPKEKIINKIITKQFNGKETISGFVFSIIKRKDNSLLFNTDLGLKTYNYSKESFAFYKQNLLPSYFQITCMFEDQKSDLWFGTNNGGLYEFEDQKGIIKIYDAVRDGLAFNWVSVISGDQYGNLWIGTWGGGISIINNKKVIENFNDKNGLYDNKIRNILEDREGNIIIGTNENGLLIYKGKKFISFAKADGLINEQVWAITQDNNGKTWFGTNEGIAVFSPETKKFESFTKTNSQLISNQVRFLKRDKKGNIWIGTNDNGIQQFDVSGNSFIYDRSINKYFPNSNSVVTALEIDNDNNVWFGTTDGLVKFNMDKKSIASFSQGDGLAGNDISSIYCDRGNTVWIGSKMKGLSKIIGNRISKVDLNENFTPKCILEDQEGKLWIGTENRGIIVLFNEKIVNRLTTNEGLLSNNIVVLNADNENNIFIGTSAGLNKFNQKVNKLSEYTEKCGFTGIEVKDNATYKDREGNIWFGTIKGAIKYTKINDKPNQLEPITFINRFRVNFIDRFMEDGIKLSYLERSVTFDFGSICFSNTQGVRYLYKLVGADKDWIPNINNVKTVTYYPLPPGNYSFQVKAANNDGIWNTNPVVFNFKIIPPFWKTWWFYLLLVAIILIILVFFIKARERTLLREKRRLEEKVKSRTAQVVKEKEKSESLLLNTLPVKVVNELKMNGKSEPESFDNVTVCFTDICDFTNISTDLDPHFLIKELNDIFTAFDDIMVIHKSERIKTIGDSYLAVCGMPEEDKEHALNLARAAIEMRKYILERAKTHEFPWEMRIGLHTGKVTGGIVGVRKYLYDVFGDTVNTASRMESNSEPMRINCSETTYKILQDKFRFTEREEQIVKGKGKMKMYFIEEEII